MLQKKITIIYFLIYFTVIITFIFLYKKYFFFVYQYNDIMFCWDFGGA